MSEITDIINLVSQGAEGVNGNPVINNIKVFRPVMGYDAIVKNADYHEGYVYFATDTGNIYMDACGESKILMGNSASTSVYYGKKEWPEGEEPEDPTFGEDDFNWGDEQETHKLPAVNSLILNEPNGCFYKVISQDEEEPVVHAKKLTVSGGGGGGGGLSAPMSFKVTTDLTSKNLLNGRAATIGITGVAAKDEAGIPLDDTLSVAYQLAYKDGTSYFNYANGILTINSGEEFFFDVGSIAKHDATTKVTLTCSETNAEKTITRNIEFITSSLSLQTASTFSNASTFDVSDVKIQLQALGSIPVILDCYWDGVLVDTQINSTTNSQKDFTIIIQNLVAGISHGYHTFKAELFQNVNGQRGLKVDPLEFEIAAVEGGNTTPIIWLGDYQDVYYNYDSIKVPFRVWDRTAETTVVYYYNSVKISELTEQTVSDKFSTLEIVDFEIDEPNYYWLACGEDCKREFSFVVKEDPTRDMNLQKPSYMKLKFDAKGRSNSQAKAERSSWSYEDKDHKIIKGIFNKFNWKNNGWVADAKRNTCLRISNGASFTIPFGKTTFASGDATKQSWTIEMEYAVRNIQKYGNLISNITRYKNDNVFYTAFLAQSVYDNYDAFLHFYLPAENDAGVVVNYDDLEFNYVQKDIHLDSVTCGYYSKISESEVVGLCVGPQDAFFSNGENTVNISYVEDELIKLTVTYNHSNKLISIYINGVMTGIIKSTKDGEFIIDDENIVFKSDFCDIDLYKFRIYNTALSINDILINYAVDTKDADLYDLNLLAEENTAINEYQLKFKNMTDYNDAHIDSPIMPYIIFDTSKSNTNDMLSWSKKAKFQIGVTFVNPSLDRAYATGELESLAIPASQAGSLTPAEKAAKVKNYYLHHCPSWISSQEGTTGVEIAVQGTSSEFYPRRNYKLKTKQTVAPATSSTINIFLNKGPYAEDYQADVESARVPWFYMDNDGVGTTKFTMKVDYMESSGSYNTGFANLVANAYSKHPLKDYLDKNALVKDDPSRTAYNITTEEYVSGKRYYYYNHKGNPDKNCIDDDVKVTSKADYDLGPVALAAQLGVSKVLNESTLANAMAESGLSEAFLREHMNKWHVKTSGYSAATADDISLSSLRTSIQGFPTLAFQRKTNGTLIYIGRYNMNIDKGSDECYGFKGNDAKQNNVVSGAGPTKLENVAECWEMENNARGFCSFRDPWNRKQLRFKAPDTATDKYTAKDAPIVADSFEHRYNVYSDELDLLFDLKSSADSPEAIAAIKKKFPNVDISNKEEGRQLLLDLYSNFEKAVAWVWSTNTDVVPSQGTYKGKADGIYVGKVGYRQSEYYYLNENSQYVIDESPVITLGRTYYSKDPDDESRYINAYVGNEVYAASTYYTQADEDTYVLCEDEAFNELYTYYKLVSRSDEELAAITDPIVKLCTENSFDAMKTYYNYNGDVDATDKAVSLATVTAETYEPGKFYIANPTTYNRKEYKYDTKEYRIAKFKNELKNHFDLEYLATYFVMTEVFECYDSRGKNCMMASWGPLTAGGDYMWYPIFYDIDTQLGINNTGIPSFDFNVDATEANNFSTSDSLLWNNFYKYFKNSSILAKYKHLRGVENSEWPTPLTTAPLKTIDRIENWYECNPTECSSIAMRGKRPLIAINLDEYYKYITITNNKGLADGSTGWLSSSPTGPEWVVDNGTYFYALQGDRSLSRRKFLSNRIEYIDSWLNEGDYQRGGANHIRGRVSANNSDTSDVWVETDANPYYDADGNKSHQFDAEYWVNLKPVRSSYVTLSDDNEAYPSEKYDGVHPLQFKIAAIENGVRRSPNYPEQLLYIYGMNQMNDVGDISNLYWREFVISGNASKLTKLLLGHDAYMTDPQGNIVLDGSGKPIRWHNDHLNKPTIPASSEDVHGMPLLKEVNLSNIRFYEGDKATSQSFDFTSSEKLQNFRATGSNISSVKFADGVALDTLYLPNSITSLTLSEASQLKNLIRTESIPHYDPSTKSVVADPGLYIQQLFDTVSPETNIQSLNISGGSLGYDSFRLMKQWHDLRNAIVGGSANYLTMKDVLWSPYEQLVKGDSYIEADASLYYKSDGHYGLVQYVKDSRFDVDVLNGLIFKKNPAITDEQINLISDISLLQDLITNPKFRADSSSEIPNITGLIYINNTEAYAEQAVIYDVLQNAFPNVTFLFKTVDKAYSVEWRLLEDNGTYEVLDFQKITSGYFSDPWTRPKLTLQKMKDKKDIFDFYGWSAEGLELTTGIISEYDRDWYKQENGKLVSTTSDNMVVPTDEQYNLWNQEALGTKHDYVYYAAYGIHKYTIRFFDGNGDLYETKYVPYGDSIVDYTPTGIIPKSEEEIEDEMTYRQIGWATTKENAEAQNILEWTRAGVGTANRDRDFYASFEEVSVYDAPTDEKYFKVTSASGKNTLSPADGIALTGKITIPNKVDGKPIHYLSGFSGHDITHIFFMEIGKSAAATAYCINNPMSLLSILYEAFAYCTKLVHFDWPSTVTSINDRAFFSSNALLSYDLSDMISLTSLGGSAFKNCWKGNGVTLVFPGNLQTLTAGCISNQNSCNLTAMQFGGPGDPCCLTTAETNSIIQNDNNWAFTIIIYGSPQQQEAVKNLLSSGAISPQISITWDLRNV